MKLSKKLRTGLLIAGALLLILVGLIGGLWWDHRSQKAEPPTNSLIPTQISQKLSFPVYVPDNNSTWNVDVAKTSYDQQSGVLSLYLENHTAQITLTQQATPQVFSDVPQQYAKMLSTMNEYLEIQTSFGTVALTRPKELNGGQTAVVNKTGTLLFAKPNRDMSEDEWKNFFNNLHSYK